MATVKTQPQSEEAQTLVAPVQSVQAEVTDPCWNCQEQLVDSKCPACGFDKALIYNLDLEADRAVKRQQAAGAVTNK